MTPGLAPTSSWLGKDAFEMADLVRVDKFPEVHIPAPYVLEARELIRARKDVVAQCTQALRLGILVRRDGSRLAS